jgi:hypothetical protein
MSTNHVNFVPQKMVDWFSPTQLAGTGLRVALSGMFAAYSDKREIEAILSEDPVFACQDRAGMWIDFVADAGDGFNSCYTIARLLAEEKLDVRNGTTGDVATGRGEILVMGGDQAYPCANTDAYENHLVGPYRAALPHTDEDHPQLFVIPGNHDWYDGLTAFMRVFCQQEWIGGWKAPQNRSYFAVKLPHRWWLFGIDIQFDTYIDSHQMLYFKKIAEEELEPNDSVILCTAKPSWVETGLGHPDAFRYLDYFERTVIQPKGARLRLCLTGDAHHYARYSTKDDDIHRITAGGGGAYLSATHHLPETVTAPAEHSRDPKSSRPVTYQRKETYPSVAESRRMRPKVLYRLPLQSRSLALLIGGVYVLFAWAIESALSSAGTAGPDAVLHKASWMNIGGALIRSPFALALMVILGLGLRGFTKTGGPRGWLLGLGHLATHLAVMGATVLTAAALYWRQGDPAFTALFTADVLLVGGLAGSFVFAGYLIVADLFGCNTNELFAAQRIEDYKGFVRLHIDEDGALTVYPVGVRRVAKKWDFRGPGDGSWFAPRGEAPRPHLIEAPFTINPLEEP